MTDTPNNDSPLTPEPTHCLGDAATRIGWAVRMLEQGKSVTIPGADISALTERWVSRFGSDDSLIYDPDMPEPDGTITNVTIHPGRIER
ncbi:hypothetical protein LCGC14_1484990 [marine sediment metagenome]|uniref:Uncharacterized protein n=1 Tax=marine sediment metagenome TaxID=412755 RepID=A0A0F9J8D2_9ZZZZ